MNAELRDGFLLVDGEAILERMSPNGWAIDPASDHGVIFLTAQTDHPTAFHRATLGHVVAARRYTTLHRYEPFWCAPKMVTTEADVPDETQFLLADLYGAPHILIVPLFGAVRRYCLRGTPNGLEAVGGSNDPYATADAELAVMVAIGDDPYELMSRAAQAVNQRVGTGRLRTEKPLPDFVDQFGWCTWDAFYQEVDADKVRLGLESFADGGIRTPLLILDDGWQSEKQFADQSRRLTDFAPNAKFGGDLTPTVRMAKDEFGVRTFLVWHAFHGYWSGVDPVSFADYGVQEMPRYYGASMLAKQPGANFEWWGSLAGVVPPEHIARFYHDYHASLAAQGVDGVKVDNQAMAEALTVGLGGRVAVTQAYRKGLEASVQQHFAGRLINCMSNANEMHLMAADSTVTRTSTDFWPNIPSSHGEHLQCNAHMGLWFGQFVHPDWDMFQSGHPMGAYHAAARAISGSPVYVSDKPDGHDFEVLHRVVLSDGSVPRTDSPALPTLDCLFVDCTKEPVPLKIFSTVGDVGLVAAFHAAYSETDEMIAASGSVGPADVPGLTGHRFAAWSFGTGLLGTYTAQERIGVDLGTGEWAIFAFAPIIDGFAPIGLINKLNAPGTIRQTTVEHGAWVVTLRDGGRFLAYLQHAPSKIEVNGAPASFTYDADTGALTLDVPLTPTPTVRITM